MRAFDIDRQRNRMTDLQLYIAIGLPTIAVLASRTVSLVQISGIVAKRGG